jgi:HEPN domain-containing protein
MFRKDFQELALVRLREARALLAAGAFDGAYYLGGLAVECALKACIARATERYEFPDQKRTNRIYTHTLETLLKEAGLEAHLRAANPAVQAAWAQARVWKVETRYKLGKSKVEAAEFVNVVGGRSGVVQWVKRYW